MSKIVADGHASKAVEGARSGTVRAELEPLVTGIGFEPERADGQQARKLLDRDGAVILSADVSEPDSLVRAAADVLGTRLRRLFEIRPRGLDREDFLPLHNDGANVVVDLHGQMTRLRDPDEDYLLMLCASESASGGASIITDAYRLIDRLQDTQPELYEFLTSFDVDVLGGRRDLPGVPPLARVCRHVEYTRGGRRVVRISPGAGPMPRDPRRDHVDRMLDLYADIGATLAAHAPRFMLHEGEILFIDNYRCWHGRDPYESPRLVYILNVLSADAM